jgi:hypothetical protein
VATAVGVGVLSAGATAIQGGSSSDILRSAVIGGIGSYVGGQVASRVTSAVAQQTGASLVDIEPALRGLSGEGTSAAGVASITAGNVAGAAASAAITGQPIEQAALFGVAQSIPTALTSSQDFRSLNPVVQNVLASSAQAAVMGQDVGDAAIASLVASSGIVARAIKEVPGGEQFIQQNPVYAKYVIDSVSSAIAAQLQGKDVSESVLYSLARTTTDVLSDKFQDAQEKERVEQANARYQEAKQKETRLSEAQNQVNALLKDPLYAKDLSRLETNQTLRDQAQQNNANAVSMANMYVANYNNGIYGFSPQNLADTQKIIDQQVALAKMYDDQFHAANNQMIRANERLTERGFFTQYNSLLDEIETLTSEIDGIAVELRDASTALTQNSANLFTDFETELATTLAPLTAFEETDVTDQDLLAEISPVAPPTELAQGPVVDQDLLNQIQEVAARPDVGVPTDATELAQATAPTQIDISGVGGTERFRQGTQSIFEYPDGRLIVFDDNNPDGREISYAEYQDITGSPYRPIGGLQIDITTGEGISEGQVGAGTGTPGAPAIDLGAQAPTEIVDPAFTIGFDLRDYGPGSLLSPNVALFEIGGGRGAPGGTSVETTFSLVSRDTRTGQEIYDVGGKQYSLVVLPDKQVLVPEEPSEVIVFIERDQETNLPKMKEVPFTQVPPQDAEQIVAKVEETAGGAPTGAEGAAGGLTAETPTTTTPAEQLQPGVRPEEVISGEPSEPAAPSFPDLISGITEPTMPAPVPGADAGFEDALQAPGAGGVGDEITDEDIIRIIQGEMGEASGGEGEGLPGEEGAGPGEGEEGAGPGAGEEGEGEGAGGEGGGIGEAEGEGAGEGGTVEEVAPTSTDIVPTITTVSSRTFTRPAEGAPYRVTGMDESGILGRKQPLFGGDEDLQRAEWNRRSLRLRRLLGL